MSERNVFLEELERHGVSRREFVGFCSVMASALALPKTFGVKIAKAVAKSEKPVLVWLEFQDCAGNTEAFLRAEKPSTADVILDTISVDYHETIMAAAGHQAEAARAKVVKDLAGKYIAVVEGAIPTGADGAYCTIGGRSALDIAREVCGNAAATIAIGTCAAFGGLPKAKPNPTGAVAISDLIRDKPVVNVPGCPPIPVVMTGVLAHYLTFGSLPELDKLGRPKSFYGETIHDRCYRRPFYDQGKFAKTFDDEGARKGWCLFELGCKGPVTYNACATVKWNDGTSFPIESGHGCLGCSEPDFWDAGGFYRALSLPAKPLKVATGAAMAGAAVGAAMTVANRSRRADAKAAHQTATIADLEK